MRIAIKSKIGEPAKVVCVETGEELQNVLIAEIIFAGKDVRKARITIAEPDVDIEEIEAEIETSKEHDRRRSASGNK